MVAIGSDLQTKGIPIIAIISRHLHYYVCIDTEY